MQCAGPGASAEVQVQKCRGADVERCASVQVVQSAEVQEVQKCIGAEVQRCRRGAGVHVHCCAYRCAEISHGADVQEEVQMWCRCAEVQQR